MRPWWTGLPPVELQSECGGEHHRVVWADGELHVPDHPDADRERALTALGADPFPCLDLLDAWRRHTEDLEVLVLASRGPSDDVRGHMDEGMGYSGHQHYAPLSSSRYRGRRVGWAMAVPGLAPSHGQDGSGGAAQFGVEELLRLGSGLPERLVATVIGIWADRIDGGDDRAEAARSHLQAALYGRLLATVRQWTGTRTTLDLVMVPPGDGAPQLSRAGDHLEIAVPFSWLRDVWVNGLQLVLGQLCLLAEQLDDGKWRLRTASLDESLTVAEWNLLRS